METDSDMTERSRFSGTMDEIKNKARNAKDVVKESLSDVKERLGRNGEGMNWKKILSVAAVVGTIGAIALSKRRNKNILSLDEDDEGTTSKNSNRQHNHGGRRRHSRSSHRA